MSLISSASSGIKKPALFPSEMATQIFYYPNDKGTVSPFSFKDREYLAQVYDSPNKRLLLKYARQSEKCGHIDTPVFREDGSSVPMGSVRLGDRVASFDVATQRSATGTVAWTSKRFKKECIRLTTRQGHSVVVGLEHPMRTWGGWTPAGSIRLADRLAVARRSGVFTSSEAPPRARIGLTALLLGDGGLTQGIAFTQMPGPALDEFTELLTSIGHTWRAMPARASKAQTLRVHVGSPATLRDWLSEDGLMGKLSHEKAVPSWVFGLSRTDTSYFLNRLWSTDGSVKIYKGTRYAITYCSVSLPMVQQVQSLLWKFGIPSRIRKNWPNYHKSRGVEKYAYILHVETQPGIRTFLQEIGALGKSEDVPLPTTEAGSNRDTLPTAVMLDIHRVFASLVGAPRNGRTAANSPGEHGLHATPPYPPSVAKLQQYVDYFRADGRYDSALVEQLAQHLESDCYWDEVVSVENVGEQPCCDFEVVDTHTYVAAGFITHNSTTMGNLLLLRALGIPYLKCMYVSPADVNTVTFSNDRIADPISMSPELQAFMRSVRGRKVTDNVYYKKFLNGSDLRFRNAFLNADRVRGNPIDFIALDEMQDILLDVIPVIEETLSHSPHKMMMYAGTPKSFDNPIEHYWTKLSTQCEWVIPCDHCGSKGKGGFRNWIIPGYENIGTKHLICNRCGGQIYARHPEGLWASMRSAEWLRDPPDLPFDGRHISQLLVSWLSHKEIVAKKNTYPVATFYNEVLGLSYESGQRLVRQQALRDSGATHIQLNDLKPLLGKGPLFMGIDWGGGGSNGESFTHVTIGGYANGKFVMPYWKRFEGLEAEEDRMMREIFGLIDRYNIHLIGTDFGGGHHTNDKLRRNYGHDKILMYQYCNTKKLYHDQQLGRYMANRTEMLMMMINAINRLDTFQFPQYEAWETPHAECFLNLFGEYNKANDVMTVARVPGKPDDAAHAALYCFLASMVVFPRPDLIFPDKKGRMEERE